jgi:hypothetical protein
VESPLTPAAGEMLVPVDEARHHSQSLGIDDFNLAGQHAGLDAFFNGDDFLTARQYIAPAQGAGTKEHSILYQYHESWPPQILLNFSFGAYEA